LKKGDLGGFGDFYLIMEDFLLHYPQKGDSLFKEIARDLHTVYLDPYISLGPLGDNWAKYISGYKHAADILVDKIIDNTSITELLAFPIIFLYRHFIELSLKLIIRYSYQLYDNQSDYEQIHSLEKLWKDCRLIAEKKWPNGEDQTLDATEKIIKEFLKIDSSSYETRYPELKKIKDKKGKKDKDDRTFTMEGMSNINLQNMKELMKKIDNFLGSIGDAISIELSEMKDNESEYNCD
jgi:hypothetical protein